MTQNSEIKKSDDITIPPHAYYHLLWGIHLLSKQIDLSRLRFYVKPAMGVRIPEIENIKLSEVDKSLYEVWTNYGGIDGISGPLPLWLNELLAQESFISDDEKTPLGDFINIFSHRFTLLLYKAWLKNKAFLLFHPQGKDVLSHILLSLVGQLNLDEKKQTSDEKIHLLSYIGSLGHRPRSGTALLGMIRHYFQGIPINIKMFMKRLIDVPSTNQARIGKRLHGNIILGLKMTDISGAFRLIIGPVARKDYEKFLPGQSYYNELVNLVNIFISDLLEWDIELRLLAEDTPELKIGKKYLAKLGQNTWLPSLEKKEGVVILPAINE